jgi:hypothetical protein
MRRGNISGDDPLEAELLTNFDVETKFAFVHSVIATQPHHGLGRHSHGRHNRKVHQLTVRPIGREPDLISGVVRMTLTHQGLK